jgi:regulator of protease activity HflC (stomatin/prohibitin superfamily)
MKQKQKAATESFYEQNVMSEEAVEDLLSGVDQVMDFPEQETFEPQYQQQAAMPSPPKMVRRSILPGKGPESTMKTSEELQLEKDLVPIRETGFGIWKRIIVPPNAYVVHTRMKRKDPVTLGLGLSFRFNPYKDSYIVVPAAMQTIGVVANCISKEKQGINVLAYVQWQIDDFSIAYKKLDFSNINDPLGIVNAQLREQAEAAIKDKISTMSVEEVLTDKAPIIKELTSRLSEVAEEGRKDNESDTRGLGIKIVTVQLREALVSSTRLWEDLQAPFRHQEDKNARISHLATQNEIGKKELEARQQREIREAETMVEIERIKQNKETEAVNLKLVEESIRNNKQQESIQENIALEEQTKVTQLESEQRIKIQESKILQENEIKTFEMESEKHREKARLNADAEIQNKTMDTNREEHFLTEDLRLNLTKAQSDLERIEMETKVKEMETNLKILLQKLYDDYDDIVQKAQLEREKTANINSLDIQKRSNEVKLEQMKNETEVKRARQEINNIINNNLLLKTFFETLPDIADAMPDIDELKVLQTGSSDSSFDHLSTFAHKAMALAENLGISIGKNEPDTGNL